MFRKLRFLSVFLLQVAIVTAAECGQILECNQFLPPHMLLSARGPDGVNNVELQSGEEIWLTISITSLSPFQWFCGFDFLIHSGSDATFHDTEYLLTGAGAWTAVPPPGGTERFFTGGPNSPQLFYNTGDTLDLGRIILRAGLTPGNYTTSFSGSLLPSPGYSETAGFSYSVPVPEASSAMLLGFAISGLAFHRRQR